MRDWGFDFYWYDKYGENLFARGFEGSLDKKYDLITSFENFEHFADPNQEIEKIIQSGDTLYFSTDLFNAQNPPNVKDWWYYAPGHGQHISFYSYRTLEHIAAKYKLNLLSDFHNNHILSKNRINKNFFQMLRIYNRLNNKISVLNFFKRKTKMFDDMRELLKNERSH